MPKSQQIYDLSVLALAINSAHLQRDMYKCGTLLIRAKSLLVHGEWVAWLKNNCKIPERTVREYMKLARSPKEYNGTKPLSRNTVSKKATLAVGMIATVIDEDAPNFGESVEVLEIEDVIVTCKTHDDVIAVYLIGHLISPRTRRTDKPKIKSNLKSNPVTILNSRLNLAESRIEFLEDLLKQFIDSAQKKRQPPQDLLKEAESVF